MLLKSTRPAMRTMYGPLGTCGKGASAARIYFLTKAGPVLNLEMTCSYKIISVRCPTLAQNKKRPATSHGCGPGGRGPQRHPVTGREDERTSLSSNRAAA